MLSIFVFFFVLVCVTAGGSGGGDSSKSAGIGAYAYQDSAGNRYGGTYDIKPEDIPNLVYAPSYDFQDFNYGGVPFGGEEEFFDFFKNLQASIQEQMFSRSQAVVSFENPSSNTNSGFAQAGNGYNHQNMNNHYSNLGQQFAQQGMQYAQGFNFGMPDFAANMANFHHGQGNSAYAAGYAGPGGSRQIASISPANPNNPNVDVSSRFGAGANGNNGKSNFYSVSSSSFASSSNIGGKKTELRGAKTVVNDNGKIKKFEVHN